MITAEAMKPLGMAIKDFYAGDVSAEVTMHRDDGVISSMAVSAFFRGAADFQLDKIALDNCRGRVLDAGAGVGIHSLYLQNKGFSVYAVDISEEACRVMKQRGVKNIICGNIMDIDTEPYDTLLMLGRSITMVETLKGLAEYLQGVRRLVNPGGRILLNSMDVSKTTDPQNLAYHEANRKAGRYTGEIRVTMEYKGVHSPEIRMLHVDAIALAAHAAANGWTSEVLFQEKDGNYLASLEKLE